MAILIRYAPSGLTVSQYDQVSEQVRTTLQWPPDGLIAHVCFGSDGDLRVSEVWESREQLEAFQERLMPVLKEGGVDVESREPEVLDVHSVETLAHSDTPS